MSKLYFTIGVPASDRALRARGRDFLVLETKDGSENLFGMLAQQRRTPHFGGRIRQLDRVAYIQCSS